MGALSGHGITDTATDDTARAHYVRHMQIACVKSLAATRTRFHHGVAVLAFHAPRLLPVRRWYLCDVFRHVNILKNGITIGCNRPAIRSSVLVGSSAAGG